MDLIYAYFGCVLIGCIPSIMPYLTERLIPEKYWQDLKALFEITQPACVITYREFTQETDIRTSVNNILYIEECETTTDHNLTMLDQLPGLESDRSSIALLQHSSGTTGLQKGVALSHDAIFNQLESYSRALDINKNDVIVSWLPLYHDMGLIAGFLMPIFLGIPLVLMSPFDWVRAPYLFMQAISDYHGTLCWLPNFAYNFCATKIRERNMKNIDLNSLRAVINCSEPMRKRSHEMFIDAFKKYGFRESAIASCYAMAENVFAVTQAGINTPINYDVVELEPFQMDKRAIPYNGQGKSVTVVSAGSTIDNVEVKILDEDGRKRDEREIGEILLKSNCMLSEYYKRPDATENSLMGGWFKTGDYGYLAENNLYITGRKKDLIIIGGKNIYPKDIEMIVNEVEGVHPGRVVAFGVFNEIKGTEDVVVLAEIEIAYRNRKDIIKTEIRKKVTRDSAIALRSVRILPKKWLIKTSSGKIARALNKEKYLTEVSQVK